MLKGWVDCGVWVIGLDVGGGIVFDDVDGIDLLVVVVGLEGKGLFWLVRQNCDEVVFILMVVQVELLNVLVVVGVVFVVIVCQCWWLCEFCEQMQNCMI